MENATVSNTNEFIIQTKYNYQTEYVFVKTLNIREYFKACELASVLLNIFILNVEPILGSSKMSFVYTNEIFFDLLVFFEQKSDEK